MFFIGRFSNFFFSGNMSISEYLFSVHYFDNTNVQVLLLLQGTSTPTVVTVILILLRFPTTIFVMIIILLQVTRRFDFQFDSILSPTL